MTRTRSPRSTARRRRAIVLGHRRFVSEGLPDRGWSDIYHSALTARWPAFFAAAGVLFLLLNFGFGLIYWLGGNDVANLSPHGFAGDFFFSVETLSTVGYGAMHPQTLYGHVVATIEMFIGISSIALLTGLTFARFSKPRARILFAQYPVVHPVNGAPTLMIRVANERQDAITEASAKLYLVRLVTSPEGVRMYRISDLKLARDVHPVLALSWSLMHVIEEGSPLYGSTRETMATDDSSLVLTIKGIDENTSQPMLARHAWSHAAIRWNHRYQDIVHPEASGLNVVDYTLFDELLAMETEVADPPPDAQT